MKIFKYIGFCLLLFLSTQLHATSYYVANNGSDSNSGTSTGSPFKTIQKAATVAVAGDVVNLRAGTYREQVVPVNSGAAGAPIVYQSYPGERAVISGTEPITGWSAHSGNIYKAAMPSTFLDRTHNQDDQIFVDAQMMFLAKWPNQSVLDPTYPTKSTMTAFVSKSRSGNLITGVFDDANLTSGDFVGADIYVQPNFEAWSWLFTGKVKSVSGNRLTLETFSDNGQDGNGAVYAVGSRYYIYNKLSLLDAAGEWFHDNNANTLYLWCPGNANPSTKVIEAKKREYAFKIDGLSYITIKDIDIFACTITGDSEIGGDCRAFDSAGNTVYPWRSGGDGSYDYTNSNIIIDGLSASYITHYTNNDGFQNQQFQGMGLYIAGQDCEVRNCNINYSAGHGIIIAGRRGQVVNNTITNVGYQCAEGAAISTGTTCVAYDHRISYNTVKLCGRWGIGLRNLQNSSITNLVARVDHNDVSEFMLQDWDGGAIYTAGQDAKMVRVDHNYFHDTPKTYVSGFYVDYSKNWVVDHNVITNISRPCHLQGMHNATSENNILFYNNTCAAKVDVVGEWGFGVSGFSNIQKGTVMQNNIFYLIEPPVAGNFLLYTAPGEMVRTTNLEFDRTPGSSVDPKFTNIAGKDFTLSAASNAINAGTAVPTFVRNGITVPPYNDAITGTVDIGALEYGTPMFAVGATGGVNVPVSGVTLSKTSSPVVKGTTLQLVATILPGNASNSTVSWSSSNTAVATVTANGLVTGVASGSANITVTTADGSKTAVCAVTVRLLNDGEYLTVINSGGGAYINIDGLAYTEDKYFNGDGNAAYNGDNFYGATDYEIYHRSRFGKNFGYEIPVPEGRFYQVTLQFLNYGAVGESIEDIYAEGQKVLSNLDVAANVPYKNVYSVTVDMIYVYDGKLNLSFVSKNSNNVAICGIVVKAATSNPAPIAVTGITLDKSTISLVEGSSEQITPTIAPTNANNKSVIWTTSNSAVASVSSIGIVTGLNAGNCTITATTADGSFVKTCAVSVSGATADADIAATMATITIDGVKESAWNGVPFGIAKQVAGTISGTSDCSGTWTSLWDNNYLYMFIDVTDDVKKIDSGGAWYSDDVVEVYIDGGFENAMGYDANDFQFYFAPGDNVPHESKHNGVTGVVVSSVNNATGYRVEVKIPWTTIGVTASTNKKIGIDVMIGDDDDGLETDGKLSWYANLNEVWSNPSLMAMGKLTGAPVVDTQVPTAPSALNYTNAKSTSFTLNFTAATDNVGVESYDIYSNGSWVANSTTNSCMVTGLNPNTTYSITAKAKDYSGNVSVASAAISVTTAGPDAQAPTVPTGLAASNITATSFSLAWSAATDNEVIDSYDVYKDGSLVGNATGTSLNVTSLAAFTTYSITVIAKDLAGNVSDASSPLSVSTPGVKIAKIASAITIDGTIDAAWSTATSYSCNNVASGTVSGASDLSGSFKLLWDANKLYLLAQVTDNIVNDNYLAPWQNDGIELFLDINHDKATSYQGDDFQYGFSAKNNHWTEYKHTATTGVAYSTSQVSGGYVIEVSIPWTTLGKTAADAMLIGFDLNLVDNDNNSASFDKKLAYFNTADVANNDPSKLGDAQLAAAAGAVDITAPTVPSSLVSSAITTTSFTLSWTASTDAVGVTGYEVYQGASLIGSPTTNSFAVAGLSPNTAYSYTVKAKDANNNISAASSALAVTTAADVVVPPGTGIATWDLIGVNTAGGVISAPVTTKDAGVTVSNLVVGAGMGAPNDYFKNYLGGGNMANAMTLATAISNNNYLEFTLTPAAGKVVTISSIDVCAMTQSGVGTVSLLSNVAGFTAANIISSIATGLQNEVNIKLQNLPVSGHVALASATTFRFYFNSTLNWGFNYKAVGIGNRHPSETTAALIVNGTVDLVTTFVQNNSAGGRIFTQNGAIVADLTSEIGTSTISVIDTKGTVIKTVAAGSEFISFKVLNKGVYVVRVQNGQKLITKKVVL